MNAAAGGTGKPKSGKKPAAVQRPKKAKISTVGTMMDIKTLISFWGDKNLCLSKSSQDLSEYSEITYSDCKDNTKVKLFALNKVGHDWPEEINSTSTNEFIWNFLKEN